MAPEAVSASPSPSATTWPPPCPVCRGQRFAPEAPGSADYCEACEAEGTAVEWLCSGCASVIDTLERPAEIHERAGKVAYRCGDCASAPTLF